MDVKLDRITRHIAMFFAFAELEWAWPVHDAGCQFNTSVLVY